MFSKEFALYAQGAEYRQLVQLLIDNVRSQRFRVGNLLGQMRGRQRRRRERHVVIICGMMAAHSSCPLELVISYLFHQPPLRVDAKFARKYLVVLEFVLIVQVFRQNVFGCERGGIRADPEAILVRAILIRRFRSCFLAQILLERGHSQPPPARVLAGQNRSQLRLVHPD